MNSGYTDELPLLYDHVALYGSRGDIGFYVDLARGTKGDVLELGCGSGRILLPIARLGKRIDGLDSSEAMLARCARKLDAEPNSVKAKVSLHGGDARGFDLGRVFALVIAPFRVLQNLCSIDDQLGFLRSAARHLAGDGRLAFDVFNPNFSAMVASDGIEREDTPPTTLPDGRVFRRTARVKRVRRVDQISEIDLTYYLINASGEDVPLFVHSLEMRWYLRSELVHLIERSGMAIEAIYGDFDGSPLTDASPEIIAITRPK
ncbi:MAG: class I SAM-dependent methyltransferase [Gemmatimonadaceae bacterium]